MLSIKGKLVVTRDKETFKYWLEKASSAAELLLNKQSANYLRAAS